MRSRWPVLVALLVVGLVVGWGFAARPLADRWSARQAEQRAVEFSRDNPAVKHFDRLTIPTGLLNCGASKEQTTIRNPGSGSICWAGDLDPRDASAGVRVALTAVGARQVTEHCRTLKHTFVVCRIDARLGGQPVAAFIGPRTVSSSPAGAGNPPAPSADDPRDGPASPSDVPRTWDGSQVSLSIYPALIPDVPVNQKPVSPE
jgi:hypothetical protein